MECKDTAVEVMGTSVSEAVEEEQTLGCWSACSLTWGQLGHIDCPV